MLSFRYFSSAAATLSLTLLAGWLAAGCTPPATDTTIYLVRHAEKADFPQDDPPLTEAGRARAQELAIVLRQAGIELILTTDYQRTRQTVEPLALLLGLEPEIYQIDPEYREESLEWLAKQIVSQQAGKTIVISGHSNTTPKLAERLGAGTLPEFSETEYDNLLMVTVPAQGQVRFVRAKYGAPSHPAGNQPRVPNPEEASKSVTDGPDTAN